jgi:HEAT repeat protein
MTKITTLDEALEKMRDPDPSIRAEATGLLDHLANEQCIGPLTVALGDPSARVRRLAVHALGCQHCKPEPLNLDIVGLLVHQALTDPSIRVRRVTVHQLGLQPFDPRAAAALNAILSSDTCDKKLRSNATFALKNQDASMSGCSLKSLITSPQH